MHVLRRTPFLLAALCAAVAGCAYYSTTSAYLPPHLKTIAVPAFGNRSYEAGVADDLTRAVTDRFEAAGRLNVVDRRNAHCVLEAAVTDIDDEPFTIGSGELAKQFRLTLTVSASFRDLTTGETMWSASAMQAWETYELSGGVDRDTALRNAVDQLAADLFNKTLSGW